MCEASYNTDKSEKQPIVAMLTCSDNDSDNLIAITRIAIFISDSVSSDDDELTGNTYEGCCLMMKLVSDDLAILSSRMK